MQFIAVLLTEPPQKLLTLGGHSIVGGGCDMVSSIFAHTGSQSVDYGLTLFSSPEIVQDARSKILDIAWTLIFKSW